METYGFTLGLFQEFDLFNFHFRLKYVCPDYDFVDLFSF
jgi:hypothetical protein